MIKKRKSSSKKSNTLEETKTQISIEKRIEIFKKM
jgi:hypothetical protein